MKCTVDQAFEGFGEVGEVGEFCLMGGWEDGMHASLYLVLVLLILLAFLLSFFSCVKFINLRFIF